MHVCTIVYFQVNFSLPQTSLLLKLSIILIEVVYIDTCFIVRKRGETFYRPTIRAKSPNPQLKNTALHQWPAPPPLAMLKQTSWTLSHDCKNEKGEGVKYNKMGLENSHLKWKCLSLGDFSSTFVSVVAYRLHILFSQHRRQWHYKGTFLWKFTSCTFLKLYPSMVIIWKLAKNEISLWI